MTSVSYALPTASASILGGIKVGTGLSISSGILSASGTSTIVNSFTPTLTGSSGTATAVTIQPTVNQSGTAAYTALLVNSIESALGSSSHYLILGQVNSSNVFTVDNAGNIATTGSFPATSLSGTLSDSRLSSNVPFKATNNIFTCAISSISSGTTSFFSITPSVQQSGTAGYTSLLINTTEISTGSGTKLLADFQVAASSKFKVDDTGIMTAVSSVIGSNFSPSGLTGVTAASRYVGATASGAPISGTFAVGDYTIDQTGTIYICTVAGTPGTWVQLAVAVLPATRCYNSTNISLTSAASTILTFDTNRYDQGTSTAQHSTSVNTSRLTCRKAGIYDIKGSVTFAANAVGERAIAIKLNGTTYISYQTVNTTLSADATSMNIATTYQLALNDYVELEAYQSSGGPLNVLTSANYTPEFMMNNVSL